nr:AraC family transcriptional regulator [Eubacterium sp.]
HIRRSIDYIYDNLHQPLTVRELAEKAGLSTSYFSRLFVKETGMNVNQFINDAKIRTAQNMLRFSDFPILDISLSLGFSSQSAFTSTFKKVTGLSPKAYRDMYYKKNMENRTADE